MEDLRVPSIVEGFPPVTRFTTFRMPLDPEKVALSPPTMSKELKLWKRFCPALLPRDSVIGMSTLLPGNGTGVTGPWAPPKVPSVTT
jgi:hypothetical protein